MTRPLGIDIHEGNGVIDFARLRGEGGISFVLVRATEGTRVDSMFHRNVEAALEAGLRVGAWGVLDYGLDVSAAAQAAAFVRAAATAGTDLPPALDFEVPVPWDPAWAAHAGTLCLRARVWLEAVAPAFALVPMVYSLPVFGNALPPGPDRDAVVRYPYWAASYPGDQTHPPPDTWLPELPRPWVAAGARAVVAQWSGDAGRSAPGVACVVDHDLWLSPELPPPPGAAYDVGVEAEPDATVGAAALGR